MFPSAKGSTMVLSAYFVQKETSIYYSVYYCALECMQTWEEGGEGSEGGEGVRTGVRVRRVLVVLMEPTVSSELCHSPC